MLWIFAACAAPGGSIVVAGGQVEGHGLVDVRIEDGVIVEIGERLGGDVRIDATGDFVVPALVDAHVHLAFWPVAEDLADSGIARVVDRASPIEWLGSPQPVDVVAAGPMLTGVGGYPTRSWGANGYGLEVTADEAVAGVEALAAAGSRVLKVPMNGTGLPDAAWAAAVARAHELDMVVVAHALSNVEAVRAARIGADVLAHTPVEPLSDEAIDAWGSRAVVSTLMAFGGSPSAVGNLARLRSAGATILYGTDLGNRRVAGLDASEIEAMGEAGMNDAEIYAAVTSNPMQRFGWRGIEAGAPAHLLVVDADPRSNVQTLHEPHAIIVNGLIRTPEAR